MRSNGDNGAVYYCPIPVLTTRRRKTRGWGLSHQNIFPMKYKTINQMRWRLLIITVLNHALANSIHWIWARDSSTLGLTITLLSNSGGTPAKICPKIESIMGGSMQFHRNNLTKPQAINDLFWPHAILLPVWACKRRRIADECSRMSMSIAIRQIENSRIAISRLSFLCLL